MFCRVCCFFVKQKTAYEMRISDWSSDVCSSDLPDCAGRPIQGASATRMEDLRPLAQQQGPRAIIFDLDGTLVDSMPDIHAAVAAFLAERSNRPLDLATITGFVGNGVPVLLPRVLRAGGETHDDDAVAALSPRFLGIYGSAPSARWHTSPGVARSEERRGGEGGGRRGETRAA